MVNNVSDIIDLVQKAFTKLGESPDGRNLLKKWNQTVQFEVDDQTFVMDVEGGKVTFRRGKEFSWPPPWDEFYNDHDAVYSKTPYWRNTVFRTDKETMVNIVTGNNGSLTLWDAVWNGKLWISSSISKTYIFAWLSKMFRYIQEIRLVS